MSKATTSNNCTQRRFACHNDGLLPFAADKGIELVTSPSSSEQNKLRRYMLKDGNFFGLKWSEASHLVQCAWVPAITGQQ